LVADLHDRLRIAVVRTDQGRSYRESRATTTFWESTPRFSVSNVQPGTLDPTSSNYTLTTSTSANSASTNVLISTIDLNSLNGTAIASGGSGTLETFTLTALNSAPSGGGAIQFLASSGNSHLSVYGDSNGNQLVLSPAPVNGQYNATIDTTVTVAVPEPSSLVLMGLAGASIILSRFRKKVQRSATL
jgi:hypothetical protein